MAAVATYREINNGGIVTKVYDVDKNGVTMKHGDVVEITGGYFKRDNGLWVIARAPGDEGWCGDYCLHRLNKNGTPSKSKDNVEFWPLTACVSDRRKTLEARAHNAEHAQIEIITPATIAAEPAKEEPKGEAAVEENAPVQPAEQTQKSAKTPRYQVIVNDDRWGGLDEKLDYSRITDARKAMRDYVNKEDWESAAIYDRKKGEIIETFGEYFPVGDINVRAKMAVETVEEYRKDQPETKPEAEPAEILPESAGEIPENVSPTVSAIPRESAWDIWNVRHAEYLESCVVPLVRCDKNCNVLEKIHLRVASPAEVETLMAAAAVGNRRRWATYNKQYRRETVRRASDIIEKYYI